MTGPFADRLFRIAFALAGCYNLAFGIWAGFWPLSFFDLLDLAPPRYPGIWACLGMVVGVYGLLYLHAAWKLETAWSIIAVGLLGKVLGPIGMVLSFSDEWPRRMGMICIYNDLIWWLPFGLFLVRGTAFGRWLERAAPWICIVLHMAASLVMVVFLRRGTLTESEEWFRAAFITEHATIWSIGWVLWMLSAASFVGFCAWWGSRLSDRKNHIAPGSAGGSKAGEVFSSVQPPAKPGAAALVATLAVVIVALGTVFDFSGEGLSILVLVEQAAAALDFDTELFHRWDAATFMSIERSFTLLSAGAANAIYTIGGIMLTLITPDLPRWVRVSMWITWAAGIAMSVAGILNSAAGLVTSSVVLFPLLIAWIAWMALRWRRP
jgi:hypothetical protein